MVGPGHLQLSAGFTARSLQLVAKFRGIDAELVELGLQRGEQLQAVFGVGRRKAEALSPGRRELWCHWRGNCFTACRINQTHSKIHRIDLRSGATWGAQQHVGQELEEIGLAQPLPPPQLLLGLGIDGSGIEMETPEAGIAVARHVTAEVDATEC